MQLHNLVERSAQKSPDGRAVVIKDQTLTYSGLWQGLQHTNNGLLQAGLLRQERVAVYLDKRPETVLALFGTSLASGVFVLVNPLLKAEQVAYILQDCNVRILVTSTDRLAALRESLDQCPDLHTVILVGERKPEVSHGHFRMLWCARMAAAARPGNPAAETPGPTSRTNT